MGEVDRIKEFKELLKIKKLRNTASILSKSLRSPTMLSYSFYTSLRSIEIQKLGRFWNSMMK